MATLIDSHKPPATRNCKPVVIIGKPSEEVRRFWDCANKDIVWGWKRDSGAQHRTVYFSGTLGMETGAVTLDRYFFHYRAKIHTNDADRLGPHLESVQRRYHDAIIGTKRDGKYTIVQMAFGSGSRVDHDRIGRLKLRRPRKSIPNPVLPKPARSVDMESLFRADLYVGSGLSYEAGLPTLCDMHDIFGVDSHDGQSFNVGAEDWLPGAIAAEGETRLQKFSRVHSMALEAVPTLAMNTIADLSRAGQVGKIFTDNVDNLLAKTQVEFERVRGSGVFNEKYPAEFSASNLIVIGVAADRRQIVRQARAKGINVIIVNPCAKVSPNVTHLEYVRPDDLFYKCTAEQFFKRLA